MPKLILLLVFSTVFTSCQDSKFVKFGAFTSWKETTRTPASTKDHNSIDHQFIKFQDPKQIALYCMRDSAKPKTCYNDHFNKTIKAYESQHGTLDHANVKALNETFAYSKVQESLNTIFSEYKKPIQEDIKEIVKKRKDFCEQNAHKTPKRCMTHYLEKDTFKVLNKIYTKNKMNGEEYLFIKSKLENHLQGELIKKSF